MIWLADFHITKADRTMLTPSTLPHNLVHHMEEIGERRSFGRKEQRQVSRNAGAAVRGMAGPTGQPAMPPSARSTPPRPSPLPPHLLARLNRLRQDAGLPGGAPDPLIVR
jgi:hypothetical protein